MKAVDGSGITTMSLSLMFFHPLMLDPSNPNPSAKVSSEKLVIGTEKCCHDPMKSMNLMSTNSAWFVRANSMTSPGVLSIVIFLCILSSENRLPGFAC
jgi:hypothetical protein